MFSHIQELIERASTTANEILHAPSAVWLAGLQKQFVDPNTRFEDLVSEILQSTNQVEESKTASATPKAYSNRPFNYERTKPITNSIKANFEATDRNHFTSSSIKYPAVLDTDNNFHHTPKAVSPVSHPSTRGNTSQGEIESDKAPESVMGLDSSPKVTRSTRSVDPIEDKSENVGTKLVHGLNELQNLLNVVSQAASESESKVAPATNDLFQPVVPLAHLAVKNADPVKAFTHNPIAPTPPNAPWDYPNNTPKPSILSAPPELNDVQSSSQSPVTPHRQEPSENQTSNHINPSFPSPTPISKDDSHATPVLQLPEQNSSIASPGPINTSMPPHVESIQNQIIDTLIYLDSDVHDLLLDQLLDRLDLRQRELALRTLGLTGGQV